MCHPAVLPRYLGTVLLGMALACQATGQLAIHGSSAIGLQPGKTTRVTLHGTQFSQPFRLATSNLASTAVQSVETTQAAIDITLPPDTPLGPLYLWIATPDGASEPFMLIVDDLPSIADNGANHTLEQAQVVSAECGIDGMSDKSSSDFYRVSVVAGQRVAFEVHAQRIGSPMDPVVRLRDTEGREVAAADDDALGPDCRFLHKFERAGDYFIEIHDSRFVGGNRYRLRVGDFPIVDYPYPLGAQRGTTVRCQFAGLDGLLTLPVELTIPPQDSRMAIPVTARLPDAKASSWHTLLFRDFPVRSEEDIRTTSSRQSSGLSIPVAISGQLLTEHEVDSYQIHGNKGDTIRVRSSTRSLGSSALLTMRMVRDNGALLAQAEVSNQDEWSLDVAFDEDGVYRLEVADLLKRSGTEFGYWIELTPVPQVEATLRADVKTRTAFSVEEGIGACPVDVSIRSPDSTNDIYMSLQGLLGEIPFQILNPRIPAGVKEARIYIVPTCDWTAEGIAALRLQATLIDRGKIISAQRAEVAGTESTVPENLEPAATKIEPQSPGSSLAIGQSSSHDACVGSVELLRLKAPHRMFPPAWESGLITLAGMPTRAPYLELTPTLPVEFARPLQTTQLMVPIKRLDAEFKGGIEFLGNRLPQGWSLKTTAEGDSYRLEMIRPDGSVDEPEQLEFQVYSEHQNRGRIESIGIPLKWIDPIRVALEPLGPLVPGMMCRLKALILRDGSERQPVTLSWHSLPDGLTGADKIVVPSDQSEVVLELQAAPEMINIPQISLSLIAESTYQGHPFHATSATATITAIPSPAYLEVFPREIVLTDPNHDCQLVVTGVDGTGQLRDWTRDCQIYSSNLAVATVEQGTVHAVESGQAELVCQAGAIRHTIPIRVEIPQKPIPVPFEHDVLAALSKQGCSSGACHGSPSGKGGFRLSLRGFDPELDRRTISREAAGRRVNLVEPERSLLLMKPLMQVPHGGGMRLRPGDAAYSTLLRWIAEGARTGLAETPKCVRLEAFPSGSRVLNRIDGGQQIAVVAHFSDQTQRDVTPLASYEISNPDVAVVNHLGRVTPRRRGESVVLVRYLEHVESIRFMFKEDVPGFVWKAPAPKNVIDAHVQEKLRQLQYLPAERCSDSEFLRRASLDITGLLPTVEESVAFLQDRSDDKRARLVDRLLERPEYAKFWALKWGDLLRTTTKGIGDTGIHKYHAWVERAIRENWRYDVFARQLLSASGSTLANPPANFYRSASDTMDCVESISQLFLGSRLQCAKCHNHPYERWTQDNYYGLAAFFHRLRRRQTLRPDEMFIWTAEQGEITQPRTGQTMAPWLPGEGTVVVAEPDDRRAAFVAWLIRPENPYFARVEANRIWSQFFARGIVHPMDDFRESNPPSNEKLLNALADQFIASGYDRKKLIRMIVESETYQASFQTNAFNQDDSIYFSHQQPRMLGAERLLDAINAVLQTSQSFGNLPAGTQATQMPAPDVVKVDFLKILGQPERATVCACERAVEANIGMAVELFNGTLIRDKLRDPNNRFRQAIGTGKAASTVIEELYLAALCRPPNEHELNAALEHCNSSADLLVGIEDVCWALINTDEFLFQH